jgi:hypothetical protein
MVDTRRHICEAYVRSDFAAHGVDHDFMDDNESSSDHAVDLVRLVGREAGRGAR